jgi:choline-sulfatase
MSWRPSTRVFLGFGAAVLVLASAATVHVLRKGRLSSREVRPNVLLVTIDTLRADRLGCYGYKAASTPVLDGLSTRGVRFTTAVAHVPLTAPSHASILTGRTPLGHGMRDNGGFVLPSGLRSLAEDFRQAGYLTAAFVSGFPLNRRFGLDRGFDLYDDHLPRGNDPRRTAHVERAADLTTDAAVKFLQARLAATGPAPQPWFLWVHYYDPHAPYEPPGDFATRFRSSPYDGEVAFVDQQLGRLLKAADRNGAVVLVTADHGESLGEHGEDTHGIFVYDSTLRVPWIMAGPEVARGRVSETVARSIDIAPTLLDYAGLPARADLEGRSLRPAAEGQALPDAPAYAESLHAQLQYGWAPLHAWRTARFKLIEAPRPELYDLSEDPGETRDRAAREPARMDELDRPLKQALATTTPTAAAAVDAETASRLAALGYAAGGPTPTTKPGAGAEQKPARDPKDAIHLATRLGRNGMAVARTDPQTAIRELTALLADDPGMLVARRTRAVAYEAAGRYEDAVRDLRALEKEGALSAEDAVVLGDSLRMAGHGREAIEVLERTARANPKFAQPWLSIGAVHFARQAFMEAAAAYEKALSIEPDQVEALRGLADIALVGDRLDEAKTRYSHILEIDQGDAGALAKLGVVTARTGRADEAIALFQKSVERDPKNADANLYLAGALASNGRPAEAVPYFERALAAGPRAPMALNGLGLTRLALGDRPGAAAAFRESLSLDPRQPDIARALRELGQP